MATFSSLNDNPLKFKGSSSLGGLIFLLICERTKERDRKREEIIAVMSSSFVSRCCRMTKREFIALSFGSPYDVCFNLSLPRENSFISDQLFLRVNDMFRYKEERGWSVWMCVTKNLLTGQFFSIHSFWLRSFCLFPIIIPVFVSLSVSSFCSFCLCSDYSTRVEYP